MVTFSGTRRMIAKLIPSDGTTPIAITRDVTIVGRKQRLCDVIIDHSSISKVHCAIARTDGLLFFRDLGSTNGTRVNGQRVTRGALLPGDELAFAGTKFQVQLGGVDPDAEHGAHTEQLSVDELSLEEDSSEDEGFSDAQLLPSDSHAEF